MNPRQLVHRASRRYSRRGLPHERYIRAGARLLPGGSGFKYFIERPHLDEVDAVSANHELAQEAGRRAGVELFAVSGSPIDGIRLGMERGEVAPLLTALHRLSAEVPVVVGVTVEDGPNLSGLAYRELTEPPDPASVLSVTVYAYYRETTTGRRFTGTSACTIEVWDEDDDGGLVAPSSNARVSVIAPEHRQRSDTVRLWDEHVATFPPLAAPDPFDVDFPIDVVYLWVDGNDPEWQQRKAERLASVGSAPHAKSVGAVRFEQGDELRFSLRSVHRYAPWVRRIFLVTDRQRPAWLKEDPGTLDLVDHTEILPDRALPTFNSHAITAAVHHIPGLSDRFLLLNDDVILGQPVRPERFFFSNGATKFFTSRAALPSGGAVGSENPPVAAARKHSRDVIHERTGLRPMYGFKHTPIAFDRSLLAQLEEEIPQWRATQCSPFRSDDDIVPEWLHHYLGYARRRCFPGSVRCSYVDIGDKRHLRKLQRQLSGRRHEVLCVNDVTGGQSDGASRHEALTRILEDLLPRPSPYETDRPDG